MAHFVIIGAGQAGSSMAVKLRNAGFEGEITLIGEEPVAPYQRPPLSKKYLLGEMGLDRLLLRPEAFYADHNIRLRLNAQVQAIDPAAKTVQLGDEVIAYDQLALTTGSIARRLPAAIGGDLASVHVVRTLADVDAMAGDFRSGARTLIIGGGYIGLEAAAVARKLDVQVTLVEMAERILQRVAAPQTSDYFRDLHRDHGVDLREGVGLTSLQGTNGRVSKATLTDGSTLDVDFVIVGVGIMPADGLASAAGLDIDNGIKTDAFGRTSDPSIWAAGDCASFPWNGAQMRLESVGNAIDQAELVAQNMMGANLPYTPKPWFWSDQYDVKLQIAGLGAGYDRIITRPGDKPGAVSFWYYQGDQLLALDAMNDPRAYMVGKRLIDAGQTADPDAVANLGTELKSLLSA